MQGTHDPGSVAGGTSAGALPRRGGRTKATYACAECGWQSAQWVGRCGQCQAWGTVDSVVTTPRRSGGRAAVAPAISVAAVDATAATRHSTGVAELDRVLGGGLVPGAVVLLAGEPGVGKSTLLLTAAAACATPAQRSLLVTGEESAAQVRMRAERVGAVRDDVYLAAETDLDAVLQHIDAVQPTLVVVDSVQTIASADVDGAAGGVSQVRAVAAALTRVAKERGIAVVLVGHVTKDGSIAGPRLLEHVVDVVLHFEGDQHSTLRLVRAVKNRFGAADEVGCFELRDDGVEGLADPSGLFLTSRTTPVPGTCATVAIEGTRPLVGEVQALVAQSFGGQPRRATSGLDAARVGMVIAVLDKRSQLPLPGKDIYVSTVGGIRLAEPAVDLATTLALASALLDRALPLGFVAIGEVGLSSEVRRVPRIQKRLDEAARLGFTHALVPPDPGPAPTGLSVTEIGDVHTALRELVRLTRPLQVVV